MNKKGIIDGEQLYPIYSITIKWTQKILSGYNTAEWQTKGLPQGRMYNSTAFSQMYKEEQDIEELKQKVECEWLPNFFDVKSSKNVKNPHLAIIDPQDCEVTISFKRYETWCLEWFWHWTFDDGRSDEEYIRSFEKFVRRMGRLPEGEYCLMGAEDRWRWKGTTDNGKGETCPPCRCGGCKKAGVVRINH